mmetsp:Transcript_875/g.2728  ORF Transcript_875/g.2728 Transcript_875/m.2728 type:complete len:216 (-) Transcript_875:159-806(-)
MQPADIEGVLGGELVLLKVGHLVRGVPQRYGPQDLQEELGQKLGEVLQGADAVLKTLGVNEDELGDQVGPAGRQVDGDGAPEAGAQERYLSPPAHDLVQELHHNSGLVFRAAVLPPAVGEPPPQNVQGVDLKIRFKEGKEPSELKARRVEAVEKDEDGLVARDLAIRSHEGHLDRTPVARNAQLGRLQPVRHVDTRPLLDLVQAVDRDRGGGGRG